MPKKRTSTRSQTPSKRSARSDAGRESLPRIGDFGMCFYLSSYCLQLEMLRERLQQHEPEDAEMMTESERTHLATTKRFLRGAYTSLSRIIKDQNEAMERRLSRRSRR